MAIFEWRDPDGHPDSGESLFCISDSSGNQVQLSQEEATQLLRSLQSSLVPLSSPAQHKRASDLFWFQPGDEVQPLLGPLQHARVLREEIDNNGRRWLQVEALANSSIQYRIHAQEVQSVSRVIPGNGVITHTFNQGELADVCPYCHEPQPHARQAGQSFWPLVHPEQITRYVEQFGSLGYARGRRYWLGEKILYVVDERIYPGVISWIVAPGRAGARTDPDKKLRYIVERQILESTSDDFFEAIYADDIVCKRQEF